jgi:hypothetical protein
MMARWELGIAIFIEDNEPEVLTNVVTADTQEQAEAMTQATAEQVYRALEGKPFRFRVEVAEPEMIVTAA